MDFTLNSVNVIFLVIVLYFIHKKKYPKTYFNQVYDKINKIESSYKRYNRISVGSTLDSKEMAGFSTVCCVSSPSLHSSIESSSTVKLQCSPSSGGSNHRSRTPWHEQGSRIQRHVAQQGWVSDLFRVSFIDLTGNTDTFSSLSSFLVDSSFFGQKGTL